MTTIQKDGLLGVSRREVMGLLTGGAVASMLGSRAANAQTGPVPPEKIVSFPLPSSWKTELKQLAPNFYAYIQGNGPPASGGGISNACVVVGPDHVMVVDTMSAPASATALIDAVRKQVGGKPFGRVVNTHHHGDHVNGNQWFMPAEIVSHPYCRERVVQMRAAVGPGGTPDPAYGAINATFDGKIERRLMPATTTVTDKATYYYGDTVVELFHPGIAHTWGDLLLYLPQHKILFAGDIAFFNMTPFVHNGQATKWVQVLDKILDMDVQTIIPGHGPIGGKKEVAEMREFYRLLIPEAKKRFDGGMSAARAAATINMGRFTNWMGAERIVQNVFRLYCEFDGTLTPLLDEARFSKVVAEYNAIRKGTSPAAGHGPVDQAG